MLQLSDFKKGMIVEMISDSPAHGFGEVKKGDMGIITGIVEDDVLSWEGIKVCYPTQSSWNAQPRDLKIIREATKIEVDMIVRSMKCAGELINKEDTFKVEKISDLTGTVTMRNTKTGGEYMMHISYLYSVKIPTKEAARFLTKFNGL